MNSENQEDKLLFAKVLDRLNSAIKKEQSAFTDFLDPVRCESFLSLLAKKAPQEIIVKANGGFENAERKMLGMIADEESFPITPITFTYNARFSKPPSHRDYLGAVLGLGLERGKIGDILIGENGATIYVSSDVAEFICENLQQAGRTAIKGKIGEALTSIEPQGKEKRITVPSLRTDAVISSAFNLSRRESAALIESEKVFVNWKPVKKTQLIYLGDTITIRGHGRVVIKEQAGNTKKDRIILIIIM
ncbi:MAG: YlmH/Sll1252 family protein [Defluviitaleaceae bacterium]|nr:YlmH/Sll1252 family protein [Defluviitaleaceae bacterium]